ncbi:MAG: glycosyltransferase family 2 protein [Bacteroidota bacterium]
MKLSVIIPTFNEADNIGKLVQSLNEMDDLDKEIIFSDGGSDDGTREKITDAAEKYGNIVLVDNPGRYVSHAFNNACKVAKGDYIALIGAHSVYPADYFRVCVEHLDAGLCDAAGGFLLHQGSGATGEAIAYAMSTKFGVGDTEFRTEPEKKYVDSVAFAVYNRKVFDTAGYFDEALVRDQDDEFHYRMNSLGLRILMIPELIVTYFVRNTLRGVASQYYQYGLYKPLVFRRVVSSVRPRHLVPSLFVLYLASLPLALLNKVWILPLVLYSLLALFFSARSSLSLSSRLITPLIYPVLHISYGTGFLIGLMKSRRQVTGTLK